MLQAHPLGEGGREAIDPNYLHHLLVRRWGFWYTATKNFRNVTAGSQLPPNAPEAGQRPEVLIQRLRDCEGGMLWRARSLVGDRVRWFHTVDGQVATERGLRR